MSAHKLSWGLLLLTGSLATVLGFAAFLPPFFNTSPAEREIASLPQPTTLKLVKAPEGASEDTADLGTATLECFDKLKTFEVKSRQVRLMGRRCDPLKFEPVHVQIINLSNGFEGTIYQLSDQRMTSDYMQFALGRNELELVYEGSNGETEKDHFMVQRVKE